MWPPPKPTTSLSLSLSSSRETSQIPVPEKPVPSIEASKHHEWRLAMAAEIDALLLNQTWDLVPSSPSYNLLGSKWILKTKR